MWFFTYLFSIGNVITHMGGAASASNRCLGWNKNWDQCWGG